MPTEEDAKKQDSSSEEEKTDQFAELKNEFASIKAQINALSQAQQYAAQAPAPQQQPRDEGPKEFSMKEIRDAVDRGDFTEAEADQIREFQIERRLSKKLAHEQKVTANEQKVLEGIAKYKESFPELNDASSDAFARTRKAFDYLVDIGFDPNSPKTELAAARTAMGDPSLVVKKKPSSAAPFPEQSGGGQSADNARTSNSDGSPSWVSGDLKKMYQHYIDRGLYKGWDDPLVKRELDQYGGKFKNRSQNRVN